LSLTAFGAPQKHAQRHALDDGLKIEEWQKAKNFMGEKDMYRYNAEYGFDKNGRQRYSHFNEYHKPQISLNHQWHIDYKSLALDGALHVDRTQAAATRARAAPRQTATCGKVPTTAC